MGHCPLHQSVSQFYLFLGFLRTGSFLSLLLQMGRFLKQCGQHYVLLTLAVPRPFYPIPYRQVLSQSWKLPQIIGIGQFFHYCELVYNQAHFDKIQALAGVDAHEEQRDLYPIARIVFWPFKFLSSLHSYYYFKIRSLPLAVARCKFRILKVIRMREILESEAVGSTAMIYDEIRRYYCAPYVSSLFRHLATYPGFLEWVWKILGPHLQNGRIQTTGWSRVDISKLEPIKSLSRSDLIGLDVSYNELPVIKNICETFVRVSPVNLVVSGCLQKIMQQQNLVQESEIANEKFTLPEPLIEMPSMVTWPRLSDEQKNLLGVFETVLAGEKFVPGIYLVLARWPLFLGYAAEQLGPKLKDEKILKRCERIADKIFESSEEVLKSIDVSNSSPPVNSSQKKNILSAISTYRQTSPQMVGFGSLLLKALPTF